MHILFVDDQPDTREVFAASFAIYGHVTHLAASGSEALTVFAAQPVEAVVVDMEMPDMDGLTLTSRIRALPQGHTVPIVLFTAYDLDAEVALEVGADALVHKPILPRALLQTIDGLRQLAPPVAVPLKGVPLLVSPQ